MSRFKTKIAVAIVAMMCLPLMAASCDTEKPTASRDARKSVDTRANARSPYLPHNDVEFKNYNEAQKLYDSPTTIIWCSTTWGNPSAPIVTIPVAGKLTSSSVSYFPGKRWVDRGEYTFTDEEARSVDGMYHGTPAPYRYGFTPGGQYVDFFNMPTVCTTALTKFQRQATKVSVSVDSVAKEKDSAAQSALKRGDKAGAQRILDTLESE